MFEALWDLGMEISRREIGLPFPEVRNRYQENAKSAGGTHGILMRSEAKRFVRTAAKLHPRI